MRIHGKMIQEDPCPRGGNKAEISRKNVSGSSVASAFCSIGQGPVILVLDARLC